MFGVFIKQKLPWLKYFVLASHTPVAPIVKLRLGPEIRSVRVGSGSDITAILNVTCDDIKSGRITELVNVKFTFCMRCCKAE